MDSETEYIEKQLQGCLGSIYDSSRTATEINTLESKLESLTSIKQTLIAGENISATNLDQMNKTINDLQTNIDKKRESMSNSEKQVINGFMKVISHVASNSTNSAVDITNLWQEQFEKFKANVVKQFQASLDKTDIDIQELRASKLDMSYKEEISRKIKDSNETVIQTNNRLISDISNVVDNLIKVETKKIDDFIATHDEKVIMNKVRAETDQKLKEHLETIEKNKKDIQEFDAKLNGIIPHVRRIMESALSAEMIGELIKQMPDYRVVKEAAEKISSAPTTDTLPNIEAMKQSITNVTSEITELKQNYQKTKVILDTIRSRNLDRPTGGDQREFDQEVAVQRMEHIEKEVQVIYNHIQFIDTTIKVKAAQAEEREEQQGNADGSNKRARIDLAGNSVNHDQCAAAISDLQAQHQKLLDFILQSKDTVLDESFQQRLEAVIYKIEQVLMNHERFIHFLIDPFAASKADQASISTAPVPEGTLSPAMIDAIKALIKKKSEEVALPLERRIKLLEEKLKTKSS